MSEYHKINSIFKRDMESPGKKLLLGEWATPELEYLANNHWEFTEKIDGTNIRVIIDDRGISFGGRTDNASIPAKLTQRLMDKFIPQSNNLRDMFPDGAVLYGEGFGAGIQKAGALYGPGQDFILFDVRVNKWWLDRANVEDIARQIGVQKVPVIGIGTLHDAVDNAMSKFKSVFGDFDAEGIVARPMVSLHDRSGNRVIAKIKCRDF